MMILWEQDPSWWRYLGLMATSMIAYCLPYGSRTPYPVKFLVGISYSLPLLFIGLNTWMAVTPIAFIILFILSNRSGFFASTVVWKIVEFLVGVSIAISMAYFIHQKSEWLMIAIMGLGGTMWATGGTGPKYVRRYIMPFVLTALLAWGFNL